MGPKAVTNLQIGCDEDSRRKRCARVTLQKAKRNKDARQSLSRGFQLCFLTQIVKRFIKRDRKRHIMKIGQRYHQQDHCWVFIHSRILLTLMVFWCSCVFGAWAVASNQEIPNSNARKRVNSRARGPPRDEVCGPTRSGSSCGSAKGKVASGRKVFAEGLSRASTRLFFHALADVTRVSECLMCLRLVHTILFSSRGGMARRRWETFTFGIHADTSCPKVGGCTTTSRSKGPLQQHTTHTAMTRRLRDGHPHGMVNWAG